MSNNHEGAGEAGDRPRIGVALAGGVLEGGFYEVGVLCALQDAIRGLDFTRADVYVGVSSGAVITSLLANGIPPRTLSRAILSLAGPDLNLDPNILFTPAVREYARRVAKVPGLVGRWVKRRIERPLDMSIIGSLLELGALTPVGIFDSAPMERYLSRVFSSGGRSNDFRRLKGALRVVAVKLDTSELVTFGGPGYDHIPISRAVQASLALPGFYCPVEIEGEPYIDGVARRTLNASVALEEGADLLFCVNPIVPVDVHADGSDGSNGNGNGKKTKSLSDYGLPAVLSQTFRTAIHSRMGTGFRSYAHTYPGADVILVEPELGDHRMFFSNIFSVTNRRDVCEHAYARTLAYLRANEVEIAEKLARSGMSLRREVLDDPRRTLFSADERPPRDGVVGEIRDALDRLGEVLERLERRPAA
ncbi:patatin-like phospholipase family protein [Longimicrobium sp.]|uniref:patatin-like phospholipase family protein n=1 Tax=Longimicrobium sp. TaxID=2029185 RepID=UPI002D15864B|nr:patatin-like phospholipase family protein [Longimicrobium sp.]HSU15370.1 patatin-like phospholipase family protein [Longimicrobium sp.]